MLNRVLAVALVCVILLSLAVGYVIIEPRTVTYRVEIAGVTLTVELAETSADQQKGLSYRSSMASDHGMLFIFDHADLWGFWMHEMMFPLDIIWFNAQKQAVFMEVDLQPCTPQACPIYTPTAPALYVLEVNAGFVMAHNVTLGTTFTFVS
jgi:hypothetical protein